MKSIRFSVKGSSRRADFCPVSVVVAAKAEQLTGCALIDEARGMAVPFQTEQLNEGTRVHFIEDSVAAGQEKFYSLRQSKRTCADNRVRVKREDGSRVSVTVGGDPFTNYLYGDDINKPCLYPILSPFGSGVTRAFPLEERKDDSTDHPHHRSIWSCWGDVNGIDFWGEEKDKDFGIIKHRYFEATDSGPVFGRVVALHDWVGPDGARMMQDRIEYRFYNTPASFRLFDMDVTLYASDGALHFGDTKEGGICAVRVASPMEVDREGSVGMFQNSLGAVNEGECWGQKASWCDYSGNVDGEIVGIGVFDHPSNPRYPTYWHVRDYGLMTANPFGESHFVGRHCDGSFDIADGDCATWKYRIYVHAGRGGQTDTGPRYLDWVHAPKTDVLD